MMPNKSCILSHVIVSKQAEQHDFIGHKFNAHTLCPYRVSAKWIKIFIPPPPPEMYRIILPKYWMNPKRI